MPEFFQTIMGKRFFEGTAPNIARQLERVANALDAYSGERDRSFR